MVWFYTDDGFYSHPKVLEIPRDQRAVAIGVWNLCGSWCADKLTNGRITQGMALEIGCSQEGIDALLKVKLWRRIKGGRYEFVNWSEWQPTREQVEEKRASERERKSRARHGSAPDTNESPGVSARTPTGVRPPRPVPSRPVPTDDVTNLPETGQEELSTGGDEPGDNPVYQKITAAVVEAVAAGGLSIHPLVVPDIVEFIDARRGPHAPPVKVPTRYYPQAIRSAWPEVSQFIHHEGFAS